MHHNPLVGHGNTWKRWEPWKRVSQGPQATHSKISLTSIIIFPDSLLNNALVSSSDILRPEATACGAEATIVVHGLLESIALPAKYVVAVLAITGVVSSAEIEGLRAVSRPFGLIVEWSGVPDDLVL
jgi:hypothetical protein